MSAARPIKFECAIPVLLTVDPEGTIDFYTRRLGFRVDFRDGDPTRYLGISRDNAALHFAIAAPVGPGHAAVWRPGLEPADVNFFVADVDALFAEFTSRGAPVKGPPADQSYGVRDFDVREPNGYILRFNQLL